MILVDLAAAGQVIRSGRTSDLTRCGAFFYPNYKANKRSHYFQVIQFKLISQIWRKFQMALFS